MEFNEGDDQQIEENRLSLKSFGFGSTPSKSVKKKSMNTTNEKLFKAKLNRQRNGQRNEDEEEWKPNKRNKSSKKNRKCLKKKKGLSQSQSEIITYWTPAIFIKGPDNELIFKELEKREAERFIKNKMGHSTSEDKSSEIVKEKSKASNHDENKENIERRYSKRVRKERKYVEYLDDELLFCEKCDDYMEGMCPDHPVYLILDNPVPRNIKDPLRASKTIPFPLYIKKSSIKYAGKGVFTYQDLKAGLTFGPYEGMIIPPNTTEESGYGWNIKVDETEEEMYTIDATDPSLSNWMRFVNSANTPEEVNFFAFQYRKNIYYKTIQDIQKGSELLTWYGSSYGKELQRFAVFVEIHEKRLKEKKEKEKEEGQSKLNDDDNSAIIQNNDNSNLMDISISNELPFKCSVNNDDEHELNSIFAEIMTEEQLQYPIFNERNLNIEDESYAHLDIFQNITEDPSSEIGHSSLNLESNRGNIINQNMNTNLNSEGNNGENNLEVNINEVQEINDNNFYCNECDFKSKSKKNFKMHKMTHCTEFFCDDCGDKCTQLSYLIEHEICGTDDIEYYCYDCYVE